MIFLLNMSVVSAQMPLFKNSWLKLEGNYGFVIPEYKNILYTVQRPIGAIELSLVKRTLGKSEWEQIYKYPEYGLTLQHTTLGNTQVLGTETGLFPFVQFCMIRKPKIQLTNQFGLGLGYASKKFDLVTNYDAVSIGSNFNIHFNYKIGIRFQFSNSWIFNSGLSFTHFSNANMAEPNLGLNLLYGNLGVSHKIGEQNKLIKKEIQPHIAKHELDFIYAAGGKHTRALQSTIFFTSSLSTEYHFQWKRKLHFGAGIDLFYDSSSDVEMAAENIKNHRPLDDFSSGIHLSQEIIYDCFSFILQEGLYIGLENKIHKSLVYNRAILRWKINSNFLMHISMKSHLHILDYPELGFGYYFLKQKRN